MNKTTLHQGHVLDILRSMPAESVHCVVTSPPYWGLRDYGIEAQVWGEKDTERGRSGEAGCEHEWGTKIVRAATQKGGNWQQAENGPGLASGKCQTRFKGDTKEAGRQEFAEIETGFCRLCGAWRGSYGLEPTIELFVEHTVAIFREVQRVLRPDGCLFLNLGDSFSSLQSSRKEYIVREDLTEEEIYEAAVGIRRHLPELWRTCWGEAVQGVMPEMLSSEIQGRAPRGNKGPLPEVLSETHRAISFADQESPEAAPSGNDNGIGREVCLLRGNRADISVSGSHQDGGQEGIPKAGRSSRCLAQSDSRRTAEGQVSGSLLELQFGIRFIRFLSSLRLDISSIPKPLKQYFRVIPGLKPKDLCGVPWRVALALQADGWWLRSDIIWCKCLSGGTRLYARTQKGEMPSTLKDLVRLAPATVQLWNGRAWTQVKSWTKSPRTATEKEIIFRSGERVGSTLEHRWPTARGLVQTRALKVGDVVDTCTLPEGIPRTPECLPNEIGWFVGLYIAEGSQSQGTIQISSHIKETTRFDRLCSLAESFDGYMAVHNTGGNAATANINSPVLLGIINAYVSGRTAKDKHLHVRCWKRSNDFLRHLLSGYLEGDGCKREQGWRLGFCANDNLAADLRTICARLGLSVRLKRTQHTCNGKKYPGWRGEIKDNHRNSGGEIIAIVPSRARIFWDIEVEGDPHLFSLASGVLTHNSNPMPESCTDRPTKAHEYIFLLTKSANYFWDQEGVKEKSTGQNGAAANFQRETKDHLIPGQSTKQHRNDRKPTADNGTRNLRTVWEIATESFPSAHLATFPQRLVERCIKAGTSEHGCCPKCGAPWNQVVEKSGGSTGKDWNTHDRGEANLAIGATKTKASDGTYKVKTTGWIPTCKCLDSSPPPLPDSPCPRVPVPCTVLDPFSGAGTTALVAAKLGRDAIGIELKPEYMAMAATRLRTALGMLAEVEVINFEP